MIEKMSYVIFCIIGIVIISLFLKLIANLKNYKIYKKGTKVKAIIIGYYTEINSSTDLYIFDKLIHYYPVVKFTDINGNEVISISNVSWLFPVYKIGQMAKIKYYKHGLDNIVSEEIYINSITTKKEMFEIYSNVKWVFFDIKHNIDQILELILIALFGGILSILK